MLLLQRNHKATAKLKATDYDQNIHDGEQNNEYHQEWRMARGSAVVNIN